MDLPKLRNAETGYLRIHFWIDSTLVWRPLSLKISQTIASGIYLNGNLIDQFGKFDSKSEKEQIYYLINHPISILFKKPGDQILTIHFSFNKSDRLLKYKPTNYTAFKAVLVETDINVDKYASNNIFTTKLSYYKLGISLFLFLLHLLLYLTNTQQKANIFISFYALCWCFSYYADNEINTLPINGHQLYILTLLNIIISYSTSPIFSLLVVYSYFKEPKRILFWFIIILIFIGSPIGIYFPNFSIFYNPFVISGILALESFRVAFKNFNQHKSGAKFIIAGWVFYIFFMGLFYLAVFGLLHIPELNVQIYVNLGLLSLPICYSLLLAVDTADINRLLQLKLKENENLFNEKQQILFTQNETLEKQVVERTAELVASQAQLIQSEKLASLGELTAGIAHEIQNPLNFVNNFAEVSAELLDDMKADLQAGKTTEAAEIADDLQVNLQKINHHGQRASAIVKGMLEHSRTSTGTKTPTDINALADEYFRLSYHGLRAKDSSFNATMETHFAPDLPKIEIIPQDIGRVLLNLINNAFYAVNERNKAVETLHATSLPYQPTVTITNRKLENTIEISVKDTGNGIPEAIKDKIFQPFFTTKPTGQGTGLGLSLAYDIVTKGHGGTLEVETKVGNGTIFIIQLPLQKNT
jgi:signal transduction histidine kinase